MDNLNLVPLLVLILVLLKVYQFLNSTNKHWQNQNVPIVSKPLPGLGNMWPVISLRESISSFVLNMYRESDASMAGFYFMEKPSILVRDPEVIKSVLQTNFMSFRNNAVFINEQCDPILARNPSFTIDYHMWKLRRARMVSYFTSKKLKCLFSDLMDVSDKLSAYVDRKIEGGKAFECELKHLFVQYAGEIVANTAFCMDGQSFDDDPHKYAFVNVAPTVLDPTLINAIKQALLFFLPDLANSLGVGFMSKSVISYFYENLRESVRDKVKFDARRSDFLQFCVDKNTETDIDNIVADVVTFYADVYETSSSAIASVFYYLSKSEKVQDKLRDLVNKTLEDYGGEITYDFLKDMPYMDQVINESLRLITPLGLDMKVCTEEISLQGSDGITCRLEPGNIVFISTMGLHGDSKHWPNPETFDPERFLPINNVNRDKFVFLPFGEGPRKCLGMKYGLMMVKLVIVKLLSRFYVRCSTKTKEPFRYDPTSFLTIVKGGLWAKFEKIT